MYNTDNKTTIYFSYRIKEKEGKNEVLRKLTRRLEHITNFRANASRYDSQEFQVIKISIQAIIIFLLSILNYQFRLIL